LFRNDLGWRRCGEAQKFIAVVVAHQCAVGSQDNFWFQSYRLLLTPYLVLPTSGTSVNSLLVFEA
jgi:hypothetical protein